MLVIKIELWPGGMVTRAREIGRVFIANKSNLADVSDYEVLAEAMGAEHLGTKDESKRFIIEGYNRKQSVFNLLARVFSKASNQDKISTD